MPPKPAFDFRYSRERNTTRKNQRDSLAALETVMRTEITENEDKEILRLHNQAMKNAEQVAQTIQQRLFAQRKKLSEDEVAIRNRIKQDARNGYNVLSKQYDDIQTRNQFSKKESLARRLLSENEEKLFTQLSQKEISDRQEKNAIAQRNASKRREREKLTFIEAQINKIICLSGPELTKQKDAYTAFIESGYKAIVTLYADDITAIIGKLRMTYGAQFMLDNAFFSLIPEALQKLQGPSPTLFDFFSLQVVAADLKIHLGDILFRGLDHSCGITLEPIAKLLCEKIFIYKLPPLIFNTLESDARNLPMANCLNMLVLIYNQLQHIKASLTTAEFNSYGTATEGNFGYNQTHDLLSRFFTNNYPIDPRFFVALSPLFEPHKQNFAFHPGMKTKERSRKLSLIETEINKYIDEIHKNFLVEKEHRAALTLEAASSGPTP